MFCSQCGNPLGQNDIFCSNCGATKSSSEKPVREPTSQIRPWVRFWARMYDIYMFSFVCGLILVIIAPQFVETANEIIMGMILLLIWAFVEAMLLSVFQTTPGKWFFKTKLVSTSGRQIDFSQALSRSLKIWWRGLGMGFPLVSLATLTIAYKGLTRDAITKWDKDTGFSVTHDEIGIPRILAAIAFFIGYLILIAIGKEMGA